MKAPDTKGWALIALFALTFFILGLLAWKPELEKDTLFVTLATAVVGGGGLLNALSYYFGSSASAAKKDATIATQLPASTNPDPQASTPGDPT